MSKQDIIRWTRLPDGVSRDDLHESPVLFAEGLDERLLKARVHTKPDGWFEVEVVSEAFDHSTGAQIEHIRHQTADELFRIERLLNQGVAPFRLSSYKPTPSDLLPGRSRAAALRRLDPTDQQ